MRQSALFEDVETKIAMRPSEYGKEYLKKKYSEFRNRFFDGDRGNLPPEMEIGFSNTVRALGHCKSRVRMFMNVPQAQSCEIMLSDAYDFTPKKLDEVLIHEMIHAYLYNSRDIADVKDSHGPRFQQWCSRINSASDFNITTKNDTPVTLNQGVANRIANDGSVLLVAPEYKPGECAIIRISEKDLAWAIPRAEKWLNATVTPYACSDANFKKGLTLCRTRLSAAIMPKSTVDDMIQSGIMKEIPRPAERAPQDGILVAWPWYRDQVAFCLSRETSVDEIARRAKSMQADHGIAQKVSRYKPVSYFEPWDRAPAAAGNSIDFGMIAKDAFNEYVIDGTLDYLGDI
jgi:hypothetical protein